MITRNIKAVTHTQNQPNNVFTSVGFIVSARIKNIMVGQKLVKETDFSFI